MFYDLATEFLRSVHDARILRSITIFQNAERSEIIVAPEDFKI